MKKYLLVILLTPVFFNISLIVPLWVGNHTEAWVSVASVIASIGLFWVVCIYGPSSLRYHLPWAAYITCLFIGGWSFYHLFSGVLKLSKAIAIAGAIITPLVAIIVYLYKQLKKFPFLAAIDSCGE